MITDVLCLATAIFFEARDQPITGQEAVADVVMNRVEHERFPDDVCGVVYQPKAFSFTHDGKSDDMNDYQTHFDKIAQEDAIKLAEQYVKGGHRLGNTSTHYQQRFYGVAGVRSSLYIRLMVVVKSLGSFMMLWVRLYLNATVS